MNDLDLIRELLDSPTRIVPEAQRRLKRAKRTTNPPRRRNQRRDASLAKGLVKAPGDP